MVKTVILLSSVAVASAGMAAIWKIVLADFRPADPVKPTNESEFADPVTEQPEHPEFSTSTGDVEEDEANNSETAPECPTDDWKTTAEDDWDSVSDCTEWSSIADDDDEYNEGVRELRSARWIHVGYGRYIKCS